MNMQEDFYFSNPLLWWLAPYPEEPRASHRSMRGLLACIEDAGVVSCDLCRLYDAFETLPPLGYYLDEIPSQMRFYRSKKWRRHGWRGRDKGSALDHAKRLLESSGYSVEFIGRAS